MALRQNSNPERATHEKSYLKSPFKFLGVSLPETDRVAKEFKRLNPQARPEYILELAARLWDSEYHDEKRLAVRILQRYGKFLTISGMPMLEGMLQESPCWDLVDDISIHLVGGILEKDKRAFRYLKRWGKSDNFWMRRASLISQILLFRGGGGDKGLFFRLAEAMLSEKEFFVRKAIGWSIREMSKANPDEAFEFLLRIKDRASGLTLREGAKRLPEKQRKLVLDKG